MTTTAETGPTNNATYNRLLTSWGDADPECEYCGADLTGCDVIETATSWLCVDCAEDHDDGPMPHREDFHADG